MPTGEIVEMPDNPTPEQLAALSRITAQSSTAATQSPGTKVTQQMSNPAAPGGGVAQPPGPPIVHHAPWAPEGTTLRTIQHFLEDGPAPDNPTVRNLARGVGLAGRAIGKGFTGSAYIGADALTGLARMAGVNTGPLPSQRFDALFPQPQGVAEHVLDFAGQAAGGMGDPMMVAAQRHFNPPPLVPNPTGARLPTPKEQTLMQARREGYVATPSQGKGGIGGSILEGLSGKSKLAKQAQIRNQAVTDELARQASSLAPGAPLTNETLDNAMRAAYESGYAPLENAGQMTNGRVYRQALDDILAEHGNVNASFPQAAHPDVADLVSSYRQRTFDAGNAVEAIKNLRREAGDAYRANNGALARTKNAIANALESSIELNLNARGEDGRAMLDAFRAARQQIAKQNVVQRGLVEGSGSVNALKIGQQLQKAPGKLTDQLNTIGKFASVFGPVASMPKAESVVPTSIQGVAGWSVPTAIAGWVAGTPAAGAVASVPFAQYALRKALLSNAGQRLFVDPNLVPGALSRAMANPAVQRALPGLLGQQLAGGLYGQPTAAQPDYLNELEQQRQY